MGRDLVPLVGDASDDLVALGVPGQTKKVALTSCSASSASTRSVLRTTGS
jgi:hypothetical protein